MPLYATIFIMGTVIGSFLNVVINRLPMMLLTDKKINLCLPASHCKACLSPIHWYDNIPLISYLLLKGKCRNCQQTISLLYPGIELLTALLSLLVVWHFGITIQTGCALVLTWTLICLACIDVQHQIIPDEITLPMLWLGLLLNSQQSIVTLHQAVLGAALGYLSLWTIYWLFKLATRKEGMGYGDFKLLAMLGAWLGYLALPMILLISSALATVAGLYLIVLRHHNKNTPIPFAPYLAIAGFVMLLMEKYPL